MRSPLTFTVQPRLFLFLIAGFIVATIVGTVSHEMGHYIPANAYGYNPELHYQMVSYGDDEEAEKIETYYDKHKPKITSVEESPEKSQFRNYLEKQKFKSFIVTLCGPVQTMATGTIGFLLLWFNRKKIRARNAMALGHWLMVLITFFWSRQLANMILWTGDYLFTGRISYRGDEIKMSRYIFNLQHDSSIISLGSVGYITGIIAIMILTYTVFKIIPKQQRLTFLCAGLTGSVLGWIVWMETLGPALLP